MSHQSDSKSQRWRKLLFKITFAIGFIALIRTFFKYLRIEDLATKFQEDLIGLIVATALFIPLIFAVMNEFKKEPVRWPMLIVMSFLWLNLGMDFTEEIRALDDVPVIGDNSEYLTMTRDALMTLSFVGLAVVIYMLAIRVAESERRRALGMLGDLSETTSKYLGEDFFNELVEGIANALNIKYVFIARRPEPGATAFQIVSLFAHGKHEEGFLCDYTNGPCEKTLKSKEAVYYPKDLQVEFPNSDILKELGVDSYLGLPMHSTRGELLGHLCVLDDQPMNFNSSQRYTLDIFASRVGAEFERIYMEEERREFENRIVQAQKTESLGALAGGIAHDFNNILTAILVHANIARKKMREEPRIQENLEQIEVGSHQAAGLCQQMLAYSGRSKLEKVPVGLNEIVKSTLELVKPGLSKQIIVEHDLDESLKPFQADQSQIEQIVLNLMTNAAEAIGDGDGSIHLKTYTLTQEELNSLPNYSGDLLDAPSYSILEISDSGGGMEETMLQRIFDPFYSTKSNGRGLGLAATLGAIRSHRGGVAVKSRKGVGTVVYVILPVESDLELSVEQEEQDVDISMKFSDEITVLIIEDEESVLDAARLTLEDAGIRVLTSSDGLQGLAKYKDHQDSIQLVLLDLTMPVLSGLPTFQELRRLEPGIPVIMMSGYSEDQALDQLKAKNLTFLQKPFSDQKLLEKVYKVMKVSTT